MYLGWNNVRVVWSRVWKIDQECVTRSDSQLDLATNSRVVTRQKCSVRVKHVGSWRVRTTGSLQDKKYNLANLLTSDWNLWFILVASDLLVHHVLLKTNFSHSISYSIINTLIPTKCREVPKRILKEKP